MAFSADELRVLRCALAHVLTPTAPRTSARPAAAAATIAGAASDGALVPALAGWARTAWIEDVQDVLRLAESIDEAVHEAGRMRAFALADLARYRAALPGAAAGYLERLEEALADGYLPDREDLSALRGLSALPCAPHERARRLELRARMGALTEAAARHRLERVAPLAIAGPADPGSAPGIGSDSAPDNVADFARPPRSSRQRDKSRPAAPAAGVHPHSLPTRRGGPIPMAAFDPAAHSAESDRGENPSLPADSASQVRAIPTPGDLWPRGVRKRPRTEAEDTASEDTELATGTG